MFSMIQVPLGADSDEDVCQYRFPGKGRLILNTVHGQIIIDVRADDVNAFVFESGQRVDHLLIKP
jgi:hypothetical protein